MLTLKHIEPNGVESIESGITAIVFHPGGTHEGKKQERQLFALKGEAKIAFEHGDVYVMNENGRTVGSYHITERP